jgi:Ca-activated chloride channel family protein
MRVFGPAALFCLVAASAVAVGPFSGDGDAQRGRQPGGQAAQPDVRGVVSGVVVFAEGTAAGQVTVDLLRQRSVAHTTKTNARGEFQFRNVPPGIYELRASRDGIMPAAVRLVVDDLPVPPLRLSLGIPLTDAADSPPARMTSGVSAGVPGGVVGGVVGGLPSASPSPAAAPAPLPEGSQAWNQGAKRIVPYPVAPDFNTEAYDRIEDNRFRRASDEPVSTFSIDVDTASYSNVRRFLNDGTLPPADAVRIEELINYFRFSYPDAKQDAPFSVTTEVAPCPWNTRHRLALIGLQARRQESAAVARNLVFLLDVSGSMTPADKLPLVKAAMRMLVDTLTPQDRVAIVVYAGASGLALPSTSGDRKAEIHRAIAELRPGGSTNGAAGIQLAYDIAASAFVKGGVNRVILATDGDFNVGVTSQGELVRLIEAKRERGIFLSVLGVGTGNLKDSTMEKLADKGNGNYAYLDSLHEARRVLIAEAGATLVTVAKDVKIQIELNPRTVAGYRLIGYENRVLAREDFNDDRKDAGEIGAGHTVTALYELIPPGENVPGVSVDPLVYQNGSRPTERAQSGELLTLKLRYKSPDGDRSQLVSMPVRDRTGDMTPNLGFAAAVAQFGMLLRNSEFKGEASWRSARTLARRYRGDDPDGYRAEFIRLLDLAAALDQLRTSNSELRTPNSESERRTPNAERRTPNW